ncbi:thiamine phosphate synthase [Prosthecomicrobium pneumaticum]|uniref:Thiamine-phosphate synthase n=1 Tax=Prosthecomicrobium pneumaticum TaxID=81895 RepID=A0A7W9CUX9_9HYPH|nr:thiamine phosphate synthase [Prosthecomicrobium pneumaticum]MBB5752149.1 thiamine-phosphate pyrophosphorylase [Prosthecomicrobium pneumaticum]
MALHEGRRFDPTLYLVTDPVLAGPRGVVETVRQALDGGVTLVQLRDPEAKTRALCETAAALLEVTRPRGIPLVINDRVDVMLAVGADGVHVGARDMAPGLVRRLTGPDAIVGLSITTLEELAAADLGPVDYIGASPVHATPTKTDTGPALGLDGLARLRAATDLPIVAIGGLHAGNVRAAVEAGADGIAVVSAIMAAADPAAAALVLRGATGL